jgi:hypothetical protein
MLREEKREAKGDLLRALARYSLSFLFFFFFLPSRLKATKDRSREPAGNNTGAEFLLNAEKKFNRN